MQQQVQKNHEDLQDYHQRLSNSPEHQTQQRKKKSQQPKLVSTKQKQQIPSQQFTGQGVLDNNAFNQMGNMPYQVNQVGYQQLQSNIENVRSMDSHSVLKKQQIANSKMTNSTAATVFPSTNNQQITLNSNPNTFVFDIRQFHPMSPQIQSVPNNNLKEKAHEIEKSTESTKNKKSSGHRRNQSKSQYAVPSATNNQNQDELILSLKESGGSRVQTFKQGNAQQNLQNNLEDLNNPLQNESRNMRLHFNSLKTETFDKKSLDKAKKGGGTITGGNACGGVLSYNQGGNPYESTEDAISSKHQYSISQFKGGISDKESSSNNMASKFSPVLSKPDKMSNKKMDNQSVTTGKKSINKSLETTTKRMSDQFNSLIKTSPQQTKMGDQQKYHYHHQQQEIQIANQEYYKNINDQDGDDEIEDGCDFEDEIEDEGVLIEHITSKNKVNHNNRRDRVNSEHYNDNAEINDSGDDDDDEDEEELKEEVGELPPKIEDIQVEEYDDQQEFFQFRQNAAADAANGIDGDDDGNNDAPTVVIDSSLDDKDYAAEFRRIDSNECEENMQSNVDPMNNIQAALRSIKLQEEEEETKSKKKKVTIISVEEEEELVSHINEIRDRIKRGDTVAQQKQFSKQQTQYSQDIYHPQLDHFKSVDEVVNGSQQTASFNTKINEKQNQQYNLITSQGVQKPPLYSLTFAHPHEAELDPALTNGMQYKLGFHSIDQNAPVSCIIMDGPNILEKKKQRFERIQKLRNNVPAQAAASEQISIKQRSRDDQTPIGAISSNASANATSSQKKSVDSGSNKGSSNISGKRRKQQSQGQPKKLSKSSKISTAQTTSQKSRQGSNIHKLAATIGPMDCLNLAPLQAAGLDDATSNGSHSTKRLSKQPKSSSGKNDSQTLHLYSLKKVTNIDSNKGTRQSAQGTIKKKLMHKSKKVPFSMSQPPTTLSDSHQSKNKTANNNLIINVSQEPSPLIGQQSLKRLKTPKLKLKDDLIPQTVELMVMNPKRLSEFQSIPAFKMMPGGQSAKNTSSYKNPFFQSVNVQQPSKQDLQPSKKVTTNTLNQVQGDTKSQASGGGTQDRRVASNSFHKVQQQKPVNTATQNVKIVNKSPSQIQQQQLMCNIEPSFLTKLMKSKQDTDTAFENFKKKYSNIKVSFPGQQQPTQISLSANTTSAGAGQDKSSFTEFEKKYKKLSGLINKMLN